MSVGSESGRRRPPVLCAGLVVWAVLLAGSPGVEAQQASTAEQPRRLTPRQVVDRALDRAAYRRRLRSEVEAAEARGRAATRLPNPTLAWDHEHAWEPGGAIGEDFFAIEQSIGVTGRRSARRRAAESETRSVRRSQRWGEIRLGWGVRRRFRRLQALRREVELVEEWVGRLESAVETLRERAEAGEASRRSVRQMEADLAGARAEWGSLRADFRRQRGQLFADIGLAGQEEGWRIAPLEPLESSSPPSFETIRQRVDERPDLRALEARIAEAEARLTAERRGWLGPLLLRGGYKRIAAPGAISHGFLAGVTVPLPIFDRNRAQVEVAEARRNGLAARRELERQRVREYLRADYRDWKSRRRIARRYRREGVGAVEALVEQVDQAYEGGRAILTEVLETRRRLLEAERRLIELELAAVMARIRLRIRAGFPPRAADE